VALGDSLTAGVESASLVSTHQVNSFPALIARAAGVTGFEQPLVSEPGIPPELTLVSLAPGPIILPKASTPGSPTNLALPRPYNNLGVPGADSFDILNTVTDGGGSHDLVLRGMGTAVQEALALHPTFITLWIGNNDALGAAIAGRAVEGETLTPVNVFRNRYQSLVDSLTPSGAVIVAANVPDVTSIPFVTTIPPVVVNPATRQPVLLNGQPVPLIGPHGPLASNSFVTLNASSLLAEGIGIPTSVGGRGTPLPDSVVLDADEVAAIQDHIAGYNQAIRDIAGPAGVAILDINAVLQEFANGGRSVGGVRLTSDFLTGGIFSYDGVHPTDLGYAVVANEWIRVINEHGARLPSVDLTPLLGLGGAAASHAYRPGAEFSQEAADDLGALFPPLRRK
jgi:lysophospholipase L1-like esterase